MGETNNELKDFENFLRTTLQYEGDNNSKIDRSQKRIFKKITGQNKLLSKFNFAIFTFSLVVLVFTFVGFQPSTDNLSREDKIKIIDEAIASIEIETNELDSIEDEFDNSFIDELNNDY